MTITPEDSAKTLTQLVATEIRVQMARADVRQSQLARQIGKTEQWLSVRLRGRQPIDVNDLHLIARALRLNVHQLLPPAEVAAQAVDQQAMRRYVPPPSGPAQLPTRPRDNRPDGHPGSVRPVTRRTARIPRTHRPDGD